MGRLSQDRSDIEHSGPNIEGYLYKKSSGRLQRWQKRYFILNPPLLIQASSSDDNATQSRCIDLRKVHFVREKNRFNPKDGGFEIGYSNHILHLRAATTDECLHWLRIIQSAVAPHQAIGAALEIINEDECEAAASGNSDDETESLQNTCRRTIGFDAFRERTARRYSDAFGRYDDDQSGMSSSGSSTAASDVDSQFFGQQVSTDQFDMDDEFVDIPGENGDVMEAIRKHWKSTKDRNYFLTMVAVKFEDWLVVQADRRAKRGFPKEHDSSIWESLLLWYLKLNHKHAELERTILTSLEVSFCEDMKDRIKLDLNRRLPLHHLPKQALPGNDKKVLCSTACSSLSSFVTRCETISYSPARDRFLYALMGVLNFSSQILRRQFMSTNSQLKNGLWTRLPGTKQTLVPIAALAAQVNDCFYFSLVAKRIQAKNVQLQPCFEAFEKAFLVLVTEACKVWVEHFRAKPSVKALTHKLWVQHGVQDMFDPLCEEATRFGKTGSEQIVPGARGYLEIQIVRRGLVQPLIRALMRHSPLNKFSSHFTKPSHDCNVVAATFLKKHTKSIESHFRPSKATSSQMGLCALNQIGEFLVFDAMLLPQKFVSLHEAYQPDFRLSHARRLLAWRVDLTLKERVQVDLEFKLASKESHVSGTPRMFMMNLLSKHSRHASEHTTNRSKNQRTLTIKKKSTTVIRAGAAGAEKKAKHLMQWARSAGLGAPA